MICLECVATGRISPAEESSLMAALAKLPFICRYSCTSDKKTCFRSIISLLRWLAAIPEPLCFRGVWLHLSKPWPLALLVCQPVYYHAIAAFGHNKFLSRQVCEGLAKSIFKTGRPRWHPTYLCFPFLAKDLQHQYRSLLSCKWDELTLSLSESTEGVIILYLGTSACSLSYVTCSIWFGLPQTCVLETRLPLRVDAGTSPNCKVQRNSDIHPCQ